MVDGEERREQTKKHLGGSIVTSISQKIRERLQREGVPFRANDNIAEYIEPGEMDLLREELEEKVRGVLDTLLIDVENDHNSNDTARRIAKMYLDEVFNGRYSTMPKATDFPNAKGLDDMMLVGPISVRSTCSHHFAPVFGKLWVGVIPGERVIGLSKFSRLCRWVMERPQIQEEAVMQLADVLEDIMKPKGLAIVMKASHSCTTWRGVKEMDSLMTTSVMRGKFREDEALRRDFLNQVNAQ